MAIEIICLGIFPQLRNGISKKKRRFIGLKDIKKEQMNKFRI